MGANLRVALVRDFDEDRLFGVRLYADRVRQVLSGQCEIIDVRPWPRQARGTHFVRALETFAVKEVVYPIEVRRLAGDVAHVVDQSHAHLAHWIRGPATVVTCHDLWGVGFGSALRRRAYRRRALGMIAATRVIAVSESTRRDAIALGVPSERIAVVRNRVDRIFLGEPAAVEIAAARLRAGADGEPCVLHVGNSLPYKNLESVLGALGEIRRAGRNVRLLKIGGSLTAAQRRRAAVERVDVTSLGHVSSSELRAFYHVADCLLYPSLHEGFGWPVAEALACGRPVVAASSGALPEIAGDAALLVEPHDVSGLADAVLRVIDDARLRRELGERARERGEQLAAGDLAAELLEVYRQAVKERLRR